MNCEVCQLKELEVEHFEIREVLRCILHTVLFHRALGLVRPKDIDLELFEITYVQCGDVELERKIDEKIDQFIDRVEKHRNKKNQICLSFYEVKNKQATWFSNKMERFYWEQWYINLNVAQHPKGHAGKSHHSKIVVDPGDTLAETRSARRAALEASLREVLFQIITFVNEKKDHVPSIPNLEGVSFPYEITISRFCFWNGRVQENAPNWASYNAQLTSEALQMSHFFHKSLLRSACSCLSCKYDWLKSVNGSCDLQLKIDLNALLKNGGCVHIDLLILRTFITL